MIALPVLSIGRALAARRGWGRPAALFTLAYLSHIAGDFYPILWLGSEYYFFPNLFWPLLAANPDKRPSFAAHAPPSLGAVFITLSVFLAVAGYIAQDLVRRPPPILERPRY